jgi:hypothetical protein
MKGINRKAIFYSVVLTFVEKGNGDPSLADSSRQYNQAKAPFPKETTHQVIVAIPHLLRQATSFQADQQYPEHETAQLTTQ